jgi:hypothetical protein
LFFNYLDYQIPNPIFARKIGELVLQGLNHDAWDSSLLQIAASTANFYPVDSSNRNFVPLGPDPDETEVSEASDAQLYWHALQVCKYVTEI